MKIYARVLEISLNVDKNWYSLWNSFSYTFIEISTYKYFNFKVLLIELKLSSFRWILVHVYEISKRMVKACVMLAQWIFIYFGFNFGFNLETSKFISVARKYAFKCYRMIIHIKSTVKLSKKCELLFKILITDFICGSEFLMNSSLISIFEC